MPKRSPRPRLREGVGRTRGGRSDELLGPQVVLEDYDLPLELAGAGLIQWLQFAADPMPWWTEADLPTIAQYCASPDALEAAREGSMSGWAVVSKEIRALADALGLAPMARARMGLRRPTGAGRVPAGGSKQVDEGEPARVIPLDELVDVDGNAK